MHYPNDGRHPTTRMPGPCDLCGEPDTGTPIQFGFDDGWCHVSCLQRENEEQEW